MKLLLMLFLFTIASCAVKPAKDHVQSQRPSIVQASTDYKQVYNMLREKMLKCYDQQKGNYHIMGQGKPSLKTIAILKNNHKGIIYYQYKTEFKKEVLFYLDIQSRGPASSEINIYGKGRGIRTRKELVDNLKQWLKGKKAYCIGRGEY